MVGVGGGAGREHAMVWKLRQSPRVKEIYVLPWVNPALEGQALGVEHPGDLLQHVDLLRRFCTEHEINLAVVGAPGWLADGLVDELLSVPGLAVFGPSRDAARLEADKGWAKEVMRCAGVPTPAGRVFEDPDLAERHVRRLGRPLVVKPIAMAGSTGVVIPRSVDDTLEAIDWLMRRRGLGKDGARVVVEECLEGPEASFLALVDGQEIRPLPPFQCFKRLTEGDRGPNTGGLGPGWSPASSPFDDSVAAWVEHDVFAPTLEELRRRGIDYRGVLYAEVMMTAEGPFVFEFNTRFPDPPLQMVRLRADLADLLWRTASGALSAAAPIEWSHDVECHVVLASRGYPDKPETGAVIEGLDAADAHEGVEVFRGSVGLDDDGRPVVAGGRVLAVAAVGATFDEASTRAAAACDAIHFDGKYWRKDFDSVSPIPVAPAGS